MPGGFLTPQPLLRQFNADEMALQTGWHSQRTQLSLPEAHATLKMPRSQSPWRMMLAFAGCGTIISVGYM
jgi:manganese transport protein